MNTSLCRICLEEDLISNMISPCRCSGSSKYVHSNCLNEWRSVSSNTEHFYQCDICKFKYKFKPNEQESNNLILQKFCKYISTHSFCFFLFYFFIVFILSFIIKTIDYNFNDSIKKNIFDDDVVYLYISGIIVFMFQIFLILYWFSIVKNKKLYCRIYYNDNSSFKRKFIFFCSVLILGVLIFGWIFLLTGLQMTILYLFHIHFVLIERLNRENQYSVIINFENDLEEEFETIEITNIQEVESSSFNPLNN